MMTFCYSNPAHFDVHSFSFFKMKEEKDTTNAEMNL